MNYTSVVRILALLMLLIAGVGLLGAAWAFFAGENAQVFAFLAMATGIVVPASSILVLTEKPKRKSRPSDALAVVILWWFLSPIAAALPFVVGVENASLLTAIHEAAACITTTGHSVISVQANEWPTSLLYWRGILHLIGGASSIIMACSVLAALNLGGPGIHRTVLFTVPETSFFDAVPRVARSVGGIMAISLAFLAMVLVFSGVPVSRALSDATSALTTGMVHPSTVARADVSDLTHGIVAVGLVFGSLGLAIWLPLREGRLVKAVTDPETVLFAVLVTFFAMLVLPLDGGLSDSFSWSLSALSTSGLPVTSTPLADSIPLPILVIPGLIGGSALSAAGGVKLARLIVLGRRAEQEFRQLGFKSSILGFQFRGRELDERSVIGVWVYLIAYILAVFMVMLGYSFAGAPFEESIRAAVGALTNSGALLAEQANNTNALGDMISVVAMILGRLEILALVPVLSISFWRG